MYFNIALFSSHGTARSYLYHYIKDNLNFHCTSALVDNYNMNDYINIIPQKLNNYSPGSWNLINIDNSLGSRSAPIDFYERLIDNKTLFINLVRDPLKKFCTVLNFLNYFKISKGIYNYLDKSYKEYINIILYERFWDNMMSLPYKRYKGISSNFMFLDSEDIIETKIYDTFKKILKYTDISIDISENLCLKKIFSYEDRFLQRYTFNINYNNHKYKFHFSLSNKNKYAYNTEIKNDEICKLFSTEILYVYTNDNIDKGIDRKLLNESINSYLLINYNQLFSLYKKYIDNKLTIEKLFDVLYSNIKVYDTFKKNISWDAEYILKNYQKCEEYWNEYKKIDKNFRTEKSMDSLEKIYMMNDHSGTALLQNGWCDAFASGVNAFQENPDILLPIQSNQSCLVTINYYSKYSGKITIFTEDYELASGELKVGYINFPIPKVITKNKNNIHIILSINCRSNQNIFTIFSIRISRFL